MGKEIIHETSTQSEDHKICGIEKARNILAYSNERNTTTGKYKYPHILEDPDQLFIIVKLPITINYKEAMIYYYIDYITGEMIKKGEI